MGSLPTLILVLAYGLIAFAMGKKALGHLRPKARMTQWGLVLAVSIVPALGFSALWGFATLPFAWVFSVGLIFSLFHPALALSFFVGNSLLRPWEWTGIDQMAIIAKLTAGLCILSYLIAGIRLGKWKVDKSLATVCLIGFAVWVLGLIFLSGNAGVLFSQYSNTLMISAILFLLVVNLVWAPAELDLLREVVIFSISGVVGLALLDTMMKQGFSLSANRLEGIGMTGNSNDLASLAVIAIALLFKGSRAFRKKLHLLSPLGFPLASLLLLGLFMTQSRAAIFALGLSGFAYWAARSKNTKRVLTIGLISIPLFAMGAMALSFTRHSEDLSGSTESRLNYMKTGLNMAIHHPLTGVGFNQYPKLYESYASEMSYEWGERTAHSSWILALSETGVPGFLLFFGIFLAVLSRAWKARKFYPEILAALVGYTVTMSFLSHTYTFFPYMIFGMTIAAFNIAKAVSKKTSRKPVTKRRRVLPEPVSKTRKRAVRVGGAFILSTLSFSGFGGFGGFSHAAETGSKFQAAAGSQKPVGKVLPVLADHLDLKGSRGETLNFMLHLKPEAAKSECALDHDILSQISQVKKKKALKLDPAVRFFTMATLPITQASFPNATLGNLYDPLIPIKASKICPEWIWGELEIPRNAAPGDYIGKVAGVDLKLSVWKMLIPDEPALPAYSELTSWFNLLGHYGKWEKGEEVLNAKYTKMMQSHRLFPLKSFVAVPEVQGGGTSVKLDLTTKPNREQSFKSIVLQNRPEWTFFDFPTVAPAEVGSEKAARYLRAIQNSLKDLHRPGKAMIYLWDEPSKEDLPNVIKLAKQVRELAPDLKILVTTPYKPELERWVDIFVPVMDQFAIGDFPDPASYARLQKEGKQVWLYVSCMSHGCDALEDSGSPDLVIERQASSIRSIAWISALYHTDAFLYYSVNNGYREFPKRDPWESLWDFSGNGDGTLFYPGRPGEHGLTEHQPIPSIRLKTWREASFDAEYIRWMNKLPHPPAWWNDEFKRLVQSPRDWSRDYTKYQVLRDRVGEYLNGEAP